MTFEINEPSRYASAAATQALSLALRAEALADEIDALQRDMRHARHESVQRAPIREDTIWNGPDPAAATTPASKPSSSSPCRSSGNGPSVAV